MFSAAHSSERPSAKIARLTAILLAHALLFALLLRPVTIQPQPQTAALTMVDIPEPPPPVPDAAPEPEGASAPAAPEAEAKPVAAPIPDIVPPQIRLPELPLAPAAGLDSRAGAATRDDNGSAAGGRGIGAGLGAAGAGTGGGGTTRARRIAGNISRRDYPRIHADDRVASSVTLRLHISADGRVQDCDILRPSGNPERDAITCRLAIQRFRYEPARDAAGRAIADVAGWRQDWFANE